MFYHFIWLLDKLRNGVIRNEINVTGLSKKIQERRLQWYGYVGWRDGNYIGMKVERLEVHGERKRDEKVGKLCKKGFTGRSANRDRMAKGRTD